MKNMMRFSEQGKSTFWTLRDRMEIRGLKTQILGAAAQAFERGDIEMMNKCERLLGTLIRLNGIKRAIEEESAAKKNLALHVASNLSVSQQSVYKTLEGIGFSLDDFRGEKLSPSVKEMFFSSDVLRKEYDEVKEFFVQSTSQSRQQA